MKKYWIIGLFLLTGAAVVFLYTRQSSFNEDQFLWQFYEITEPDPPFIQRLIDKARTQGASRHRELITLLNGLKLRDQYRQTKDTIQFDSARMIFQGLIKDSPENYYGYMGMGLVLTERGMNYKKVDDDSLRTLYFNKANEFLVKAKELAPELAILYFYLGKNSFWQNRTNIHANEINLRAIYYLDSANAKRENFLKVILRSAEYLSSYYLVASSNQESINAGSDPELSNRDSIAKAGNLMDIYSLQHLTQKVPAIQDRIRFLFGQCMTIVDNELKDSSSRYPDRTFSGLRRKAEIYRAMAKASATYSINERISFLESALELLTKDKTHDHVTDTVSQNIRIKIAEIHFFDLKDFKKAQAEFENALEGSSPLQQQSIEFTHWIALAWCYYQLGNYEIDSEDRPLHMAIEILKSRIQDDPEHATSYLFAQAMMYKTSHKNPETIQLLQETLVKAQEKKLPTGYIELELAEIYRITGKASLQREILSRIKHLYFPGNDPHDGEVRWNARKMLDFYFPD